MDTITSFSSMQVVGTRPALYEKLTLSHKKCFNIHIGKGHKNCPTLFVLDKVMKESENEKYLGDYIDKSGNINATIQSRKAKGKGIVTGIMAILTEIPLGSHKMDVAMKRCNAYKWYTL